MNDEILEKWKEKTKGLFHLVEWTRFWNYITNLQQENQELKSELECYENGIYFSSKVDELQQENQELNDSITWWNNRFNAVQRDYEELKQENERLKKMNMHEHKYGSEMEDKYITEKSRIEKAVEYIKEHTFQEEIGFDNKKGKIHYGYFVECKAKELLNILNGRSDE